MFMTMEGTSGRARLSVALLAALTVSACADQGVSPVGPEETAAFAKGGKGIDGENQDKVAPSVRNSCGIKTSPIPPLPNIYASVRGEFSGVRTSSISKIKVNFRYVSSASGGAEYSYAMDVSSFPSTSKNSGI
jgi:hypothetical protein